MQTTSYNPSPLEVEIAKAIQNSVETISGLLIEREIFTCLIQLDTDNPTLKLEIKDHDGDSHQVILKIIQKPDSELAV